MTERKPREGLRSFRDMNPYAIGIGSVLLIGAFVGLAFAVGIFRIFEDTYSVPVEFRDGAGLRPGDPVRVAGINSGRVDKIRADRDKGIVIVDLEVNHGVRLARETRAEIALGTLLGAKYVRLSTDPVPAGEDDLEALDKAQRRIPVERTKTPFDVFDLTTKATHQVQATDNAKLNTFINQLADITEGNRDDIQKLLDGVAKVSKTLNERDTQLRSLIDRFDTLSALLAEKDQTLVSLLDQSQGVLDLVRRRRADLSEGLGDTDRLATELSHLLSVHKTELDSILDTLHPTVDILARRADDLDRALAYAGPGALGLTLAVTHGPFADVYVRAVGPDLLQVIESVLGGQP
jgi:phospholipid/cholesterol/gamma-HCH transport system substrate-binding protein